MHTWLQEEGDGSGEECEQVWEWHVSSQPVSVAWSPNSTLRAVPSCLQVAVASVDNTIMQLSSDLADSNTIQVRMGKRSELGCVQ